MVGLLVAYVVGFALPGYFLARLLDVRPHWCGAFVLSWFSLLMSVIFLQIVGLPISFVSASAWQLAVAAGATILWRRYPPAQSEAEQIGPQGFSNQHLTIFKVLIVALFLVHAYRFYMAPAIGPDLAPRYNLLAQVMFDTHSLDHYPPATAEDYNWYFWADPSAPVVSAAY